MRARAYRLHLANVATGELALFIGRNKRKNKAKADVRSRQKMHIRKGRELRIKNFEF